MTINYTVDTITTADPEQFSSALRPFDVRLDQLSTGQFKSQMDFVSTRGITIYRERWNRRVHVSGNSPQGLNLIGAVVNNGPPYSWQGDELRPENVAFTHPGKEMDFFTPENADHSVVLATDDVLVRHLGEESAARLKRGPLVECGANAVRRFAATIQRMIYCWPYEPGCPGDGAAIETAIGESLTELTADTRHPAGTRGKPRRQQALRRAMEYADELRRPIPVPELARAVGVSRRTLEYAFEEAFGISPLKYLRIARLNQLHHALGSADSETTTVTASALNFGFSELGRLAGEYRSLFGELPSTTLQRRPPRTHKTLAGSLNVQ